MGAWKARATALLGTAALVWAVSLAGLYLNRNLIDALAIVPRRVAWLTGVLTAPLVHVSIEHLLANTLPLLVLGGLVALRGARYYLAVTAAIAVLGGLGLWIFGRSAAHVGASGLIFGYFGFLVARGYHERSLRSIAAAIAVAVFYGGLIFGVLPRDAQVSWEGHLFGLLAGVWCSRARSSRAR